MARWEGIVDCDSGLVSSGWLGWFVDSRFRGNDAGKKLGTAGVRNRELQGHKSGILARWASIRVQRRRNLVYEFCEFFPGNARVSQKASEDAPAQLSVSRHGQTPSGGMRDDHVAAPHVV